MNNQDNNQNNNQPQQPHNGYQQPNGYPQQPYGQPYVQQPYGQPQPIYVMQPQPTVAPTASSAEKEAAFSAASSIFMLILCIIGTVNLLSTFVGNVLSLNIMGILLMVLDILIVVGTWITFANAKKKVQSSKGISLIKVPFIIQFVFGCISFVFNLVLWILTLNIIGLIIGLLSFVFECIMFASVNKTLALARDINQNKSVAGRKAGSFAAIIMIISASITLIQVIVSYVTMAALSEALGSFGWLLMLVGGTSIITLVISVIAFLVSICGAIVILQFGKKVKEAHNG